MRGSDFFQAVLKNSIPPKFLSESANPLKIF